MEESEPVEVDLSTYSQLWRRTNYLVISNKRIKEIRGLKDQNWINRDADKIQMNLQLDLLISKLEKSWRLELDALIDEWDRWNFFSRPELPPLDVPQD